MDWKENCGNRWIVPGLGIYFLSPDEQNWPLDEIVRQLHFTRQIKLNGQAYFRNRFLLNNTKGIWDELQENFYTTPALIPPMTWMDSIPPSTPAMPSLQLLPDGKMHMSWQISTDNNGGLVTYHLYASDTYPVDITDAGNLLETYLTHTEYEYTPISPWRQKRYFAVTAADRFGNESAPLELNAISETDMPLLNDGDILTLPEIKEAKTVKIFTVTGEEIKYFVYAPQMSIASLPSGFYTVYILNNAGAQTFVGTIVK